jgi:predicted PurR-regulated permease PerM
MFGLSKPIAIGLVALAFVLVISGLVYGSVREIRSMVNEAAANAKALSDQTWTARIEKSNAEANQKIADQAKAVIEIQADAADRVNAASQQLEELRKRNAALPHGGDVGLTADRVRLLPD